MNYKKITATQIFDGYRFLESDTVLVFDENGIVENIIPLAEAGEEVEKIEGVVCPGLINAHCHLELSHMKGLIPEHTGLQDFIIDVVGKRHFREEAIVAAMQAAEQEMIADGIVAVGDICNNALSIPLKAKQQLAYYNFIEVSGWNPTIAQARYEHSKNIFNLFESQIEDSLSKVEAGKSKISEASLSPHAPYSVSDDLWDLLLPHFSGKTVTIHNQESAAENELFLQSTGKFRDMYDKMGIDDSHFKPSGKTSLQSYFAKLDNAFNKILVHNTFIEQADLNCISNKSLVNGQWSMVFFCLCPNANLYIENTLPPIDLLRNNNCNIVLGTDSLASNHQLSIQAEIKTIQKDFPHIPLEEILSWATINGARALQMENTLGSFEKGKRPGVAVLHVD